MRKNAATHNSREGFTLGATYTNIHNKSIVTITNEKISDEGTTLWRGEKTCGEICWFVASNFIHWELTTLDHIEEKWGGMEEMESIVEHWNGVLEGILNGGEEE